MKDGLLSDLDGYNDPVNLPGEPNPLLSSAARLHGGKLFSVLDGLSPFTDVSTAVPVLGSSDP